MSLSWNEIKSRALSFSRTWADASRFWACHERNPSRFEVNRLCPSYSDTKLSVFFYSNEGNPREAMHIHVRNPQGEAKFWMTPSSVWQAVKVWMPARCASCKMRSLPTVN